MKKAKCSLIFLMGLALMACNITSPSTSTETSLPEVISPLSVETNSAPDEESVQASSEVLSTDPVVEALEEVELTLSKTTMYADETITVTPSVDSEDLLLKIDNEKSSADGQLIKNADGTYSLGHSTENSRGGVIRLEASSKQTGKLLDTADVKVVKTVSEAGKNFLTEYDFDIVKGTPSDFSGSKVTTASATFALVEGENEYLTLELTIGETTKTYFSGYELSWGDIWFYSDEVNSSNSIYPNYVTVKRFSNYIEISGGSLLLQLTKPNPLTSVNLYSLPVITEEKPAEIGKEYVFVAEPNGSSTTDKVEYTFEVIEGEEFVTVEQQKVLDTSSETMEYDEVPNKWVVTPLEEGAGETVTVKVSVTNGTDTFEAQKTFEIETKTQDEPGEDEEKELDEFLFDEWHDADYGPIELTITDAETISFYDGDEYVTFTTKDIVVLGQYSVQFTLDEPDDEETETIFETGDVFVFTYDADEDQATLVCEAKDINITMDY